METATVQPKAQAPAGEAIRPFKVHIPDEDLADLRRRVQATRWPDKETVADRSQGADLADLQELVRYWGSGYDWRKCEAKLNAFPQFVTTIDGVDIYFIHVRSRHPNAVPLIVTHGWPGSVIEQLKIIGPLTDPTAFGGKADEAFNVVIPSLPGYGFSGKPTGTGWDMARYAAPGLLGVHISLPAAIPPDVGMALASGTPAPDGLTEQERATFENSRAYTKGGYSAYFTMLTARPQAVGYGMADSPAGLAAWVLVHPGFAKWAYGRDPAQTLTKDDVLDDITLYWLTDSGASAARLYWENAGRGPTSSATWKTTEIKLPVAITVFGEDAYRPPETWVRRAYPSLTYFHQTEKGGHFAAWEQPELFASEMRAAFATMRSSSAAQR